MPSIVRSAEAEFSIRKHLASMGYALSPERANGETGVDILATRGEEVIHIEVIPSSRAVQHEPRISSKLSSELSRGQSKGLHDASSHCRADGEMDCPSARSTTVLLGLDLGTRFRSSKSGA
jgi:hypothetical protein